MAKIQLLDQRRSIILQQEKLLNGQLLLSKSLWKMQWMQKQMQ